MKDFLIKESSQIVIYGQTTMSKQWVRDDREMFEFYFSEGRALNYLSIQKKDALSESESSESERIFHKLIANTTAAKTLRECDLRLNVKEIWGVRSNSKYVEINLDGMSVDQETSMTLKISKFKNADQGTVVLRVKDLRIIQKIDYNTRMITLAPLYPAIPKMRDADGVELVEDEE